jgi:hypothetical protein
MTPDELKDLEQRAVAQPALYVRSLCMEIRRLTAENDELRKRTAQSLSFAGCAELRAACPWIPDKHCNSCHDRNAGVELEHDGKLYTVCCAVQRHYSEQPHD